MLSPIRAPIRHDPRRAARRQDMPANTSSRKPGGAVGRVAWPLARFSIEAGKWPAEAAPVVLSLGL